MKKGFLVLLIIVGFTQRCYADNDARQAAEKLFELMDMQSMLAATQLQIDRAFTQMPEVQNISQTQLPIYQKHREKVKTLIAASISWEQIKEPIIDVYVQVYSKEEIEELKRFYESDIGQKMVRKTPELVAETFQVMQQKSKALLPQLQALQEELRAELKAHSRE